MDWLKDEGITVFSVIGAVIILFIICRLLIPSIMHRMVANRMSGEDASEIKKRADTLSSILVKIAAIVLAVIAIITRGT